jgi:hypothetical protein
VKNNGISQGTCNLAVSIGTLVRNPYHPLSKINAHPLNISGKPGQDRSVNIMNLICFVTRVTTYMLKCFDYGIVILST